MRILQWVTRILFFVLVAVMATHSLNSINQDIGRHLKSGEIIWETKSIYKTNFFSYTEPGHPFINHHWLSEVVFYLLNGLIGLKGLILFKAGIIISAFLLLWLAVRRTAGGIPFLIAGVFGLLIFSGRTDVRPEMFSYLFLAYFLFAVFRAKYPEPSPTANHEVGSGYRWLYVLPIIQVFWTNMHIYFILGPMLFLFFLVDRLIHKPKDTTLINPKSQILNPKQYLNSNVQNNKKFGKLEHGIFVLVALATLINPNFIRGALAPLTILREYGYSIVENQNIFFLTDYGIHLRDIYLFQVSLIVLVVSFIAALKNHHKKITFEVLAALVSAVLAGMMIRNMAAYALVFIPVVTSNLSAIKPTRHLSKMAMLILIGLVLLFGWLIKNTVGNNLYRWLATPKKFGLGIPDGAAKAVNFVKENRISGPVFNNFDVGSFLIWKLFPQERVFVDGRPEAYSVEFFEKIYKPMQEDPAVWKRLSDEYQINYVFFAHTDITPWAQAFLTHISQNNNWPLTYLDSSTAIFMKRNLQNQDIIKKFEITK